MQRGRCDAVRDFWEISVIVTCAKMPGRTVFLLYQCEFVLILIKFSCRPLDNSGIQKSHWNMTIFVAYDTKSTNCDINCTLKCMPGDSVRHQNYGCVWNSGIYKCHWNVTEFVAFDTKTLHKAYISSVLLTCVPMYDTILTLHSSFWDENRSICTNNQKLCSKSPFSQNRSFGENAHTDRISVGHGDVNERVYPYVHDRNPRFSRIVFGGV